MKRISIAAICVAMLIAVTTLSAHDDYRIIGKVTKVSAKTLDVKQNKDGKVISMKMEPETLVTRDKQKIDRAELKAGANVVVDARGDSIDDLEVLEVRLVPAATTKK
jgi:hypothetical protein